MDNPAKMAIPAETLSPKLQFEEFINKKELARRIKRSPRTIGAWMRNGTLPYYKVGAAVLFKYSEVEEHIRKTSRVCRRVRFE